MGADWTLLRLGDHISVKGGLSYESRFVGYGNAILVGMGVVSHTSRFLESGTKLYAGSFSDTHLVAPGDLVIATRQQSDNLPILGYPAMIPQEFKYKEVVVATNLYKVSNQSELDNRFLYWLMRGREYREHILSRSKGTTVRMLTKDAIENFWFECPPERERSAICSMLDSLDDKIALNRRMNETLEAMARALFKDWFVDFGPTRAKMEGLEPYLAPELWALFPDWLDEEGKPAGFEIQLVGGIGSIICGKTPSTKVPEYYGGETPFITIPEMRGQIFATTVTKSLSRYGAESQSRKMLPAGAVCVSCIGTPGLVVITTKPSQTNQQINTVIPKESREMYFWYWALRDLGAEIGTAGSGGSVIANLSTGHFANLRVQAATKGLRARYSEVVADIFERIRSNQLEVGTLMETRDLLLPKLMSGEIRVREAERTVEDVV